MGLLRKISNKRMWIGVALVVVCVAIYVASLPKADAIGSPKVCAYYSDATYRTVVGARGVGCCGTIINWGTTTTFVKCQTLLCPQSCGNI